LKTRVDGLEKENGELKTEVNSLQDEIKNTTKKLDDFKKRVVAFGDEL
jgi:peptidoglycan hydrolase CwlO-like protein